MSKTQSSDVDSEGPSTAVLPGNTQRAVVFVDSACHDIKVGNLPPDNDTYNESDNHDVKVQTRCDTGTNVTLPYSLDKMDGDSKKNDKGSCKVIPKPRGRWCIKAKSKKNDNNYLRNPITGDGLNGDGVGGWKPMTQKIRGGNPLTGEGYKPGQQDYIGPVNMKSAHESINITRDGRTHIPPGGYSSGLW